VETEFANVIWLHVRLYMGLAMAQAGYRRPYATEGRVRSQAESDTGARFSPSASVVLLSASFDSCCVLLLIWLLLLPEGQTNDAWELSKSNAVLESGECWVAKQFNFLRLCRVGLQQAFLLILQGGIDVRYLHISACHDLGKFQSS